MPARRKLLYAVLFAALAAIAAVGVRRLFPSEADRLAERIEALGRRVLAGDVEAVLDHVDLARFGVRATAMGSVRTFDESDEERLLDGAREAARWLPLERAVIEVVDAQVVDAEAGEGGRDRASVALRLSFTDEGQRYADTFDLTLQRTGGRWYLTAIALRPSPGQLAPYRMGGGP